MTLINRCCCCVNLRDGCMAIGIFTLLYFTIEAFVRVYYLIWYNVNIIEHDQGSEPLRTQRFLNTGWALEMFLSLCLNIASIVLLVGIKRKILSYFWPWFVLLPIAIVIILFSSLNNLVLRGRVRSILGSAIADMIIALILIYFGLCVFSYFTAIKKEAKEGPVCEERNANGILISRF